MHRAGSISIPRVAGLLLLVFPILTGAVTAAVVEGHVTASGGPAPAFTVVVALNLPDFAVLGQAVADPSGAYSMTAPDDSSVLVIAVSSTGDTVS